MGKKKDWVKEIGNIELEISYTSGVYDLAFLMGYGWYEEVEKIVEQIKQESREEVLLELSEISKAKEPRLTQQEVSYINRLMVADRYGEDETIKTKNNTLNSEEWEALLVKLDKLSNKYHGEKYSKKIYKPTKSRKLRPSNEDSKTIGK